MQVSLFTSCLVDQLYPEVGFAALHVLARAGVDVVYNERLACCGQPAFNSGHRAEARQVARALVEGANDSLPLITLSGSCAAMIKVFVPSLFEAETADKAAAEALAARTWEFSDFLVTQLGCPDLGASFEGTVTYHDSCHALRELGIFEQPRRLIATVAGAQLLELDDRRRCCGFGGMFSVQFPEVSAAIGTDKVESIRRTGVDCVVSSDVSCLMQIEGLLRKRQLDGIRTLHLAQLLDHRGGQA